jgi:hypothetical protein
MDERDNDRVHRIYRKPGPRSLKIVAIFLALGGTLTTTAGAEVISISPSPYPYDNSNFAEGPPGGVFHKAITAHGHEVVMGSLRSFEILPVDPSTTFAVDVPEIFVVFQLHQHGAEFRVYGQWFVERAEGASADLLLGTDAMVVATEDQSGFVSLKRPSSGWLVGDYKVKLLIGTGQSDMAHIGTLRFHMVPSKIASRTSQ